MDEVTRTETHEITETVPVPDPPVEPEAPPITTEAAAVTTAVAAGAVELSDQTTAQAQQVAAEMIYLSQKEFQDKAGEIDIWRAEHEAVQQRQTEAIAALEASNSSILSTLTELTRALRSSSTQERSEVVNPEPASAGGNPEPQRRKRPRYL